MAAQRAEVNERTRSTGGGALVNARRRELTCWSMTRHSSDGVPETSASSAAAPRSPSASAPSSSASSAARVAGRSIGSAPAWPAMAARRSAERPAPSRISGSAPAESSALIVSASPESAAQWIGAAPPNVQVQRAGEWLDVGGKSGGLSRRAILAGPGIDASPSGEQRTCARDRTRRGRCAEWSQRDFLRRRRSAAFPARARGRSRWSPLGK